MKALNSLSEQKSSLRLRSPVEIQEVTGAVYHPHSREFSLTYFGSLYRISYLNGDVTFLGDHGQLTEKDESLILRYLNASGRKDTDDGWVYCARSLLVKNHQGIVNNIMELEGKREEIELDVFYISVLPKILFRLQVNQEVKVFLTKSSWSYLPDEFLDYLVEKLLTLL